MYIWILQTGEPIHTDKNNPRPMRGMNLSNFLISKGHKELLYAYNNCQITHPKPKLLIAGDGPEKSNLQKQIEKIIGKKTELTALTDPSLLGGVKLRIDNIFLDASIKSKMENLRKDLLQ